MKHPRFILACALSLLSVGEPAAAQRLRPPPPPPPGSAEPQATGTRAWSLRGRGGLETGQALLGSSEEAEQLRGLERLGTVGSAPAIERIVQWLDSGAPKSSRIRLVAVRALAPHTEIAAAEQALIRLMTGASSDAVKSDPLSDSVRASAALALAASGRPGSLAALATAIRHEGPTAEAAAAALQAYPPVELAPLIRARGAPTRSLVRLLSVLGDQRAFQPLRSFVRWAQPELRAEAAIALTELGDLETVELAQYWLRRETSPALRLGAVRILVLTHAAAAPAALARLLDDDTLRDPALEIALAAPHPELVSALERRLDGADATFAARLLGAIGRAGGTAAADVLGRQLRVESRKAAAGYALALCAGDAATAQLARALDSSATRRVAAQAAVVRERVLRERVTGTRAALEDLLRGQDPADRAAGAWGLGALDADRTASLLGSGDPVVVRAAARAAFSGSAARAAARRLARETNPSLRTALAVALASRDAASLVPTDVLVALVEGGGAAAPLAARALALRDSEELRPRLEALLDSPDPLLRSHTALGLAYSADPSVIGLLAEAYRLEPDASVRRAVIVALGLRHEGPRRRTLRLAARLDGDLAVREAARLALAGQPPTDTVIGTGAFWLQVTASSTAQAAGVGATAAVVTSPIGLGLPLTPGPDGLIAAVGLPPGPVSLRLTVATPPDPARD